MRTVMPWALLAGLLLAACADDESLPGEAGGGSGAGALDYKALSRLGGTTTVSVANHDAFAQAVPTLDPEREDAFFQGNAIFNRGWAMAPASVKDMDGLGPVFNATNCSGCHFKDGRGRPPVEPDEKFLSMLIRLSVPGVDAHGNPLPEPAYGGQLQGNSVPGVPSEGRARVTYTEVAGAYPDGTAYALRRPAYAIDDLAYGPLRADVMMSPRVAPQMIGLGLLEAVPEATVLALADPDDADGDGISGRPNRVWDETLGQLALGRFGWKANEPTIRQQVLAAFNGDMGITSPMFPEDHCTPAQAECLASPDGGTPPGAPELRDSFADVVVSYSSTLAVPAQRRWQDADVQRGRDLFAQVGVLPAALGGHGERGRVADDDVGEA
ncbi:MAG: thiol oxidoreductase, partial [Myxococcales bacterium]